MKGAWSRWPALKDILTPFGIMGETFHSRVYTDRPAYADFDSPAKFTAIQSIIAKHLTTHPNAICSYSGGQIAIY